MIFETGIFNKFFTARDKRVDVNKDINGKGTLERWTEVSGKDIDDNIKPLLDYLLENTIIPETCFERYVPFLESEWGNKIDTQNLYLSQAYVVRRKVLEVLGRLHTVRGSIRGYEVCFGMLGLTMVLTEHEAGYGLDSPITFDDVSRRLDSSCPTCSDYTVELTGTATLSSVLIAAIWSIIIFNQPINARLRLITYNGEEIVSGAPDFNNDFSDDFLI
jgi:hypothetical protein